MDEPVAAAIAEITESAEEDLLPLLEALVERPDEAEAAWLALIEEALHEA